MGEENHGREVCTTHMVGRRAPKFPFEKAMPAKKKGLFDGTHMPPLPEALSHQSAKLSRHIA
jgi:hypothetical protein